MDAMTVKAKAAGRPLNPAGVYQYFVDSCRENLHIVICMSPIGDACRTRVRMFPSLVNCCTIDWFSEWPDDALQSVAKHFLLEVCALQGG